MTEKKRDFEVSDDVVAMTETTMLGALMQCVIEQCKVLPKPWQALSEREQAEYLERVELQMRAAVKKAVFLICAQDRIVIPSRVNKVVFKDGVKAELELTPGAPGRHDLADAEGEIVHILIVDTTAIESAEGKPKPEKDQRDLPLDDVGGGDEPEPENDQGGGGAAAALENLDSLEKMPRAERDELVKRATDLVVEYQVASTTFLQQKLGVSLHVVGQILAVLASSGIVSTPNSEGLRTVLVVDGQVQESQQEAEPEAEPPKGKRVCRCAIESDEAHRGPSDPNGLQGCPGYEKEHERSSDCSHCVHDKACHEREAAEEFEVPEFEEVEKVEAAPLSEKQLAALQAAAENPLAGLQKTAAGWQPPGAVSEKYTSGTVLSLVNRGLLEFDPGQHFATLTVDGEDYLARAADGGEA